ncbi:hypothetical protein Pyn_14256 [Prunus yedoensis var. nudiflora]|uniref:Uncharacterized protein n=1 Tax=Prunus yedoensis var. nudiflora TaxID=2094558 RepID=A0A314XUZ5_PRUYE|nr:hypothetical protein Pyn_14256 [Prunus yedoensis var. nudiflora]
MVPLRSISRNEVKQMRESEISNIPQLLRFSSSKEHKPTEKEGKLLSFKQPPNMRALRQFNL